MNTIITVIGIDMNFNGSAIIYMSIILALLKKLNGEDPPKNQHAGHKEKAINITSSSSPIVMPSKSFLRNLMTSSAEKRGHSSEKVDIDMTKMSSLNVNLQLATEGIIEAVSSPTYSQDSSPVKIRIEPLISKEVKNEPVEKDTLISTSLNQQTDSPKVNTNAAATSSLDERLQESMNLAIAELAAEGIIDISTEPRAPKNDENELLREDASISTSLSQQSDSPLEFQQSKQSSQEEVMVSTQREEKTEKEKAPTFKSLQDEIETTTTTTTSLAEGEQSIAAPTFGKMSYAHVVKRSAGLDKGSDETITKKSSEIFTQAPTRTVEERSSSSSSSTTSTPRKMSYIQALTGEQAREEQVDEKFTREEKGKEKTPGESSTKLFFMDEKKEQETTQTSGTSETIRFSANRRHMLVIPKMRRVNVYHELHRLNINLNDFGVRTSVMLPSGTVFLKFNTVQANENLCAALLATKKFIITSSTSYPNQVRINDIPQETTKAEVYFDIFLTYEEIPQRVRFVEEDYSRGRRERLAIVEVSDSLLQKMVDYPKIKIRWKTRFVDTSSKILRCSQCYLIGHISKSCRMPARQKPTDFEECIDCAYHNRCSALMGRPKDQERNTNHPTDDSYCPTKLEKIQNLQKRYGLEVDDRPLLA